MFSISASAKIFICKDPIDMRNGFEGLSSAVVRIFNASILLGGFFVFSNKQKNLLKILYWDIDGPAIWYKRLEKGKFLFQNLTGPTINRKEFIMLLEGIIPKRLNKRYKL
jgi:transposase